MRCDDLHRLIVFGAECGPQDFMSAHDLIQGLLERTHVQGAAHSDSDGNVIKRIIGFKFVQKPKPLLCE